MSTKKIILLFFIITFFFTGCSKYNFYSIFPFGECIHARSIKIPQFDGYECVVSDEELKNITTNLAHSFSDWRKLPKGCYFSSSGIIIGNNYYGLTSTLALYAIDKNSYLDGRTPAIIYFPEQHKVIFFISDDGML